MNLTHKKLRVSNRKASHLLLIITALYWMSLYTYPSLLTPYLDQVGATLTQAGFIVGSYGFTQMTLRFPLGLWSDYLGRKRIFVMAGLFTAMISALGLMLTQSVWLIFVFRALAGVAASFWVQISSLYMNYNADQATESVSQINFVNSTGQIVAIFIGGQLIAARGYPAGFGLGVVFGLAGFILCFALPPDQPDPSRQQTAGARQKTGNKLSFTDPGLLWGSLLAALSQVLTFSTSHGFVPQYAADMGAGTANISLMTTLNAIARIIAIALAGRVLIRRFSPKQLLISSSLLYAVLILLLPLTRTFPLLVASMFLMGMCAGIQMTYLMDAATSHIETGSRSTAMGFYQAVYGIGMVVGPSVMGAVSDAWGMAAGFLIIGVIGLFAALLTWRNLPDRAAI